MENNHESLHFLQKILKKGDTVYTILRHVSRGGMQSRIDVYTIQDNMPVYLTYHVAKILNKKISINSGIVVNDSGMDVGFDLVYSLAIALYCPDKYDREAAYALQHKWI